MREMRHMEEALELWFASRGFMPVDLEGFPGEGKPDMAFSGEDGTVFVVLAGEKALSDRGYFMEVVMRASSLRQSCNYLYLAVPKLLAPFVDVEVLRKHGIGLLTVDDEVVEALASPKRPVLEAAPGGAPVDRGLLEGIMARLSALEARISAVEREVSGLRPLLSQVRGMGELKKELSTLATEVKMLSHRLNALSAGLPAQARPEAPKPPPGPELEGLPSFFRDNPWLEILSRRGQDEIPA